MLNASWLLQNGHGIVSRLPLGFERMAGMVFDMLDQINFRFDFCRG